MAFTSRITETLDIPGEDGQTITIRKLAHHQKTLAEDVRIDAVVKKFVAMGDAAKNLPSSNDAAPSEDDPRNKYDVPTIVRCGVVAWTYPDAITEEALSDQDWLDWAFDQIMAFSLRAPDEVKASANGSRPASVPVADVGLTS